MYYKVTENLSKTETFFEIKGASKATMIGKSEYLDVTLIGASRLFTFEYETVTVFVDVFGLSGAQINVMDFLTASIDNLSTVEYLGSP
ncbi:MAG: DUF2807 domain-containing protein [Bacteroidota bacterium]